MGNVQYYYNLSVIMLVAAVIMLIFTIIIWRKLDIRRDMAVISGKEARQYIDKIRKDAASGSVQTQLKKKGAGSIISWNTAGNLKSQQLDEKTTALSEAELFADDPYGQEATTALGFDPDFVIEREEGTRVNGDGSL